MRFMHRGIFIAIRWIGSSTRKRVASKKKLRFRPYIFYFFFYFILFWGKMVNIGFWTKSWNRIYEFSTHTNIR